VILQTFKSDRNPRHNLKSRLITLAIGALIFIFVGVVYNTHNSGSLFNETGSIDQPAIPVESLSIAAIYSGTITKNSNLYTELLNWPLPKPLISSLTARFSRLFDLHGSKPGDSFKLFVGPGDTVVAFEYLTRDWKRYRLDREGNDYVETVDAIGLERKIDRIEGTIRTSLWDALLPLLPDMEIFSDLSDIFGWEIDFLTEPRVGDTFIMIYEVFEKDGKYIRPGNILAAEYVLSGVPHRAFLFEDSTGRRDYYDANGYSLRKTFLKSPLNYRRISSRFSYNRLHPIYKIRRPHLGVDYAAGIGTPIVASGDGYVLFKGWKQGFGNYLEIKHPNGMITCYGHMRGFARGLSNGQRVAQGAVIGYVGSTGESTGPHLDYRVMKNGRFIDPLKLTLPASLPVRAEYMAEFKQLIAQYLPLLQKPVAGPILAQRN
jgi:murein DD-endopeptidase MepM/ murein hydrolase activator NlpD